MLIDCLVYVFLSANVWKPVGQPVRLVVVVVYLPLAAREPASSLPPTVHGRLTLSAISSSKHCCSLLLALLLMLLLLRTGCHVAAWLPLIRSLWMAE